MKQQSDANYRKHKAVLKVIVVTVTRILRLEFYQRNSVLLSDISEARYISNNGMSCVEMISFIMHMLITANLKHSENHYNYLIWAGKLLT